MFGAIIGDIVGSRFEFQNTKDPGFSFFDRGCFFTDDTAMTVAVAEAILRSEDLSGLRQNVVAWMRKIGRENPYASYGGMFEHWLFCDDPKPYFSYGNGSAMRISPVGFWARSEQEVKALSETVTAVTHNHPEGLKGAEAIAMAIFLAREKWKKEDILERLARDYYPELRTDTLSYPVLHKEYSWDYGIGSVTCQCSVPQAIVCFREAKDFESTIRLAVSIGGDSDTIAAMAGGIAEAYYGIPQEIERAALPFLPREFAATIDAFRRAVKKRESRV